MKRLAAMGASRLSLFLINHGYANQIENFPGLLDSSINEFELRELEELYLESLDVDSQGFCVCKKILNPDDVAGKIAWICLELSILEFMDSRIRTALKLVSPSGNGDVTVALAAKLMSGEDSVTIDEEPILKEAFRRVELLLLADYPNKNFMSARLHADSRLIDFFAGGIDPLLLGSPFVEFYDAKDGKINCDEITIFRNNDLNEICDRIAACTRNQTGENATGIRKQAKKNVAGAREQVVENSSSHNPEMIPVVIASGEKRSGRRFFLKRIADRIGVGLVIAPMHALGDIDSLLMKLRPLLRECVISDRALMVTDIDSNEHNVASLKIIVEEYEKVMLASRKLKIAGEFSLKPIFLTVESSVKPASMLDNITFIEECKLPNGAQAVKAWDYFASLYLGDKKLCSRELAVKMKLHFGDIERIVRSLACAPEDKQTDSHYIFRRCYEILDDGRYDNIKRVEAKYTYDDLKLEEEQKKIIIDICNQVTERQKVMDEWNLRSRYSYGTCVSALFSGPPGTGKTMAVHVMASILGLELYKVDLSQLVDKYIGETEKRLEEVFTRAEKSNMILFFDEADSIIGKRSEVADSKDKYANSQVNFLLQRIEEFDGIVILASNYLQNIDPAFMRRIRFTVHFEMPDEATRKEIWMSSFAPEVPIGDIDFNYLASQFEFSGGQIKNVVLNAAFFAAAENSPVEMKHVVRAVWLDKNKEKKVAFTGELGKYAFLLQEDI